MELQAFKFGNVIFEDSDFVLCDVETDHNGMEFIALIPTCLRLKKVIPSIPATVKSVSGQISNIADSKGILTTIVDSGINHDLNPFLIIEKPIGMRLAVFRYSVVDQLVSIIKQLATCLLTLHEHQIFQRDLDPNWDIFFDGFRVCVAFPGARDIFHKAYIEADDGSTVFDVPRFVIKKGSVKEDIEALFRVADSMINQARSSIEGSQLDSLQNILNQNKLVLSHYSETPELVLEELAKLSLNSKVVERPDTTSEISSEKNVDPPVTSSIPDHTVKTKPLKMGLFLVILSIVGIVLIMGMFRSKSSTSEGSIEVSDEAMKIIPETASNDAPLDFEEIDPEVMRRAEEELRSNEGKDAPLLKPIWKDSHEVAEPDLPKSNLDGGRSKIPKETFVEFENLKLLAVSNNFEDRINVTKNLPKFCDQLTKESSEIFEKLLIDPDVLVRGFAVHGYSDCRGVEAKTYLNERLKEEKSSVVRDAIEKVIK